MAEAASRAGGVRLVTDDLELVVLPELGARLHRLRVFGHDLLRTPDDADQHRVEPFWWGGYVMAPWCNRLEAVPVEVAGRTVALASNFPDGTAIHGQVYRQPWRLDAEATTDTAAFVVEGGGDGWPWRYAVRERLAVAGSVIDLELALTNLDEAPMPGGIGLHPWFLGDPEVAIRGASVFAPNTDTPAEPEPVAGPTDLRQLGPITDGLDATWLELASPPVALRWPALGIAAEMRVEAPTVVIVAASLSGIGLAVEPETHAPQGIRRLLRGEPAPLTMIQPGTALVLEMELAFARG